MSGMEDERPTMLRRADAGVAAWLGVLHAQQGAAPDHGDFYELAGYVVETLRALEALAGVPPGRARRRGRRARRSGGPVRGRCPVMGTGRGCRRDRGAGAPAAALRTGDLVVAAQCGDREAFGRLYDRHVEEVFRYVLARVGDHAAAEDLTGQVFLQAWRGIGAIPEQDRDVGGWLFSIARHLAAPTPARLPRPSAPDAHELPPEPVPVVAGAMDGPGGGHPARTGADLDGEPSGTPVGRWIS